MEGEPAAITTYNHITFKIEDGGGGVIHRVIDARRSNEDGKMTKWSRKEIQDRAIKELEQAATTGIRYMELLRKIHAAAPETPFNTIVVPCTTFH